MRTSKMYRNPHYFYELARNRRVVYGITGKMLADHCGVAESHLNNFEKGRSELSLRAACKVSKILNLRIEIYIKELCSGFNANIHRKLKEIK